jgi:endoglucanase
LRHSRCLLFPSHNYARWDGGIIGQSGVSNANFVSLWTQLAKIYGSNSRIAFGLMNEPHDMQLSAWVATLQDVVNAIRSNGAANTLILLPGLSYSNAGALPTEAGPQLLSVKNPDGTVNNLVFDVHSYLDANGSGTTTTCATNNQGMYNNLASWLRQNGRQAIVTETGAGNSPSCYTSLCEELATIK